MSENQNESEAMVEGRSGSARENAAYERLMADFADQGISSGAIGRSSISDQVPLGSSSKEQNGLPSLEISGDGKAAAGKDEVDPNSNASVLREMRKIAETGKEPKLGGGGLSEEEKDTNSQVLKDARALPELGAGKYHNNDIPLNPPFKSGDDSTSKQGGGGGGGVAEQSEMKKLHMDPDDPNFLSPPETNPDPEHEHWYVPGINLKEGETKFPTGDRLEIKDGKQTLTAPDGTKIEVDRDGKVKIEGKVQSVEIADDGSRTITLNDGSKVKIAKHGISQIARGEHTVRIRPLPAQKDPAEDDPWRRNADSRKK